MDNETLRTTGADRTSATLELIGGALPTDPQRAPFEVYAMTDRGLVRERRAVNQIVGTFERDAVHFVGGPDALEIGVTPRGPWDGAFGLTGAGDVSE